MGKIVVSYWWTKINPLIYKGFLVRETGLEPASTFVHMNLNHARLPIPPVPQVGGQGWIRTTEVSDGRFTVCSLWPLGNLPMLWTSLLTQRVELAMGLEPATC